MSDEDEKKIEDTFITQLGAKYPFVKAKGCNEKYAIKFFPSIYCIDANGAVHSVPDDRMPTEAMIEELLAGVSLVPKAPEGAAFDALRAMWQKREHLKLRDHLAKMLAQPNLDAALREVYTAHQQELEKRNERSVLRADKLGAGPDYLAASEQLQRIEKEWKGLPPAEAAKKQLDRFAGDAAIKKEITAGKALEKLLAQYDTSRQAQVKKLVVELEAFAKKHTGTLAAQKAEAQRKRLAGG